MAKDILLFLDGTRNRSSHRLEGVETNVWKLFDAVVDKNLAGGPQARYVRGIASTGAPSPLSGLAMTPPTTAPWPTALGRAVLDLVRAGRFVPNQFESATGWGLAIQIQRAYSYLCQHYEYGDRVSLFGFSRGAFAARSLAGFVDQVGLLLRGAARSENGRYLVTLAYELYRTGDVGRWEELRRFLTTMAGASQPIPGGEGPQSTILPIYFIGVWDTVDALGLEAIGANNRTLPLVRHHTRHHVAQDVPSNVTHARHAIALHELREPFEPVLWNGCTWRQVLKQVWFAGAHADVGGGYKDSRYAAYGLDWMANEFIAAVRSGGSSLQLKGLAKPGTDWPTSPPHHEIQGYFKKAEPTVRTALAKFVSLPKETQASMSFHPSATQRLLDAAALDYGLYPYETYAPHLANFPDDVRTALWKVDDLTVQLHVASAAVSVATEAAAHPHTAGAGGPAITPGSWATARNQVALRNASAMVMRRLPTMRWDVSVETKLADAIVLLAVFNRLDIVDAALQRIRMRAASWEALATNPRFSRRRLRNRALERHSSLLALWVKAQSLAPNGCLASIVDFEPTLDAVGKASELFPFNWPRMKKIHLKLKPKPPEVDSETPDAPPDP